MKYPRLWLATAVLLVSCTVASAQICTAPAQSCVAGPNGWGGCYVPGAAQCVAGMICERGALVCPPGVKGEGACYDPRVARCDQGTLAQNSGPALAPDEARPDSKNLAQSPAELGPAGTAQCISASGEDRAAILSALRTPVSSALKIPVEFVVERARICGEWAFVIATPQRQGGGAPRWAGTVCAGDTSHLAGGLIRRDATTWRLVEYALCPSDVAWSDWPETFNAPQALFDE